MAEDLNAVGDVEMAEYDGEKVVTMVDVLQEQEEFEQDANAVLGASDDKNCTYNKGYVKRQALYACMTCCPEAKDDPSKRAGVCLACSLSCHESHDCIELYTKRNFRCDCGNPKFSQPCNFTQAKTDINESNSYNQNFSGLYCTCNRPYPDPENDVQDDMIQCIICEDWLHASHLEATVPGSDQYAEMICKGCMEKNPFLHDYNDLAINLHDYNDLAADYDIDILHVTSENCDTINNDINSSSHCVTGDNTKVNSIEISEIGNEMNAKKSIPKSDSNENEMPTILAGKDIKENEVHDSGVLESDTTEENTEIDKANVTKEEKINMKESKLDPEKETSETKTQFEDCNNETKDNSKLDAGKLEVDQSLADPSLEDNIKDLTDLINESSIDQNSSNSNCFVNNDNEFLNKTSNIEDSASDISNDKTHNEQISSHIDKTEKTEKALSKIDSNEESENKNTETSHTNDIENNKVIDAVVSGDQNIVVENEEPIHDQSTEVKTEKELNTDDKIISKESERKELENNNKNDKIDLENEAKDEINKNINLENEPNYETNEKINLENGENLKINESMGLKNEVNNQVVSQDTEMSRIVEDSILNNDLDEDAVEKTPENKRKISFDPEEEVCIKKAKLDQEKSCLRPTGVKRIQKGATFWPSNFRQKLCTCSECLSMYKDLSVLFLIDLEDTVSFYENMGIEKIRIEGQPQSQYEKGLEALSSLDRVQQINALTEYNKLKDELLNFLKSFKERKEIVKEEDIKAFFAGMKPKREPDGVYFCR